MKIVSNPILIFRPVCGLNVFSLAAPVIHSCVADNNDDNGILLKCQLVKMSLVKVHSRLLV